MSAMAVALVERAARRTPAGRVEYHEVLRTEGEPDCVAERHLRARGQTRLDLALFGVDGDDLRGAEILGAEDATSDRRVIGKRQVLGPDAKRQLPTDAILMDLRHGDSSAVEADRALAALQRTLESDE